MQVKMKTNNSSLDLNSLYGEVKRDKVHFTQWQQWIAQKNKELGKGTANPPNANQAHHDDDRDDVSGF